MLCKLKSTCHIQLLHGSEHMPWASQAHLASNYFWDLAEKSLSGAFSHGLPDSTHCDTEQVKHQLGRSALLIFLMITHHRQGAPGSSFLLWRETVHYSELVFHFGNLWQYSTSRNPETHTNWNLCFPKEEGRRVCCFVYLTYWSRKLVLRLLPFQCHPHW